MTFPYLLTLITFIPLVGAVLVALLPRENVKAIKWTALIVSLIPLVLSVVMWAWYAPQQPGAWPLRRPTVDSGAGRDATTSALTG